MGRCKERQRVLNKLDKASIKLGSRTSGAHIGHSNVFNSLVLCYMHNRRYPQFKCFVQFKQARLKKEAGRTTKLKQLATGSNPKIYNHRAHLSPQKKQIQSKKRQKNQIIYSLQELTVGVHDQ